MGDIQMNTKKPQQVFVIASYEEEFLAAFPVAYAIGVEVATSDKEAYASAYQRWPDHKILEPLLWKEVPIPVRLQAIEADRQMP